MSDQDKPGPIYYFYTGHGVVGSAGAPIILEGRDDIVLLTDIARKASEDGGGTFLAILDAVRETAGGDLLEEEVDTETARQRALRLAKDAADASPPISDQRREAKAAAQRTANVIMVWRIRGERRLPHDKAETVFALAMNDEEAFKQLLHLAGLDAHEIEDYGLTFRKLQSPVNLLEKLQELTGDEYGMATQEMALPLLQSVEHQLMEDDEPAEGS